MKNYVEERELFAAEAEPASVSETQPHAEEQAVEPRQVATPVAEMFVSSY